MSAPPVTAALRALAQQRLTEAGERCNLRQLGGGCFVDVAFAQSLRRCKQLSDLDMNGMQRVLFEIVSISCRIPR